MITIRGYRKTEEAQNRIIGQPIRELDDDIITVAEAKKQCFVDFADQDTYFRDVLIPSARNIIENYLQLSLVPCEITVTIQNDIAGFKLPWGPYTDGLIINDEDGNIVSADRYKLKGDELYQYDHSILTLSYNAGYDEDTLPAALKQAILQQIADLWNNKGDGNISPAAKQFAAPFNKNSYIF